MNNKEKTFLDISENSLEIISFLMDKCIENDIDIQKIRPLLKENERLYDLLSGV